MTGKSDPLVGRGTGYNPANRFVATRIEDDREEPDEDPPPRLATELIDDLTRNIIATNDSPDIGFTASVNPYRGCEHGCIYCFARPTHEYLGFSAGLDFESKILVKRDAPGLLRKALLSPSWEPKPIAMSGVTDAYQPIERELQLARGCLEVLAEFRNPVGVVTKNRLVLRDRDLLGELARHGAAVVYVSVTTLDREMARSLEPRASLPSQRLEAIAGLVEAGIPTGVLVAPIIPGLTDHEAPAILAEAAKAGARFAGYVPLRLPLAVAPLFLDWLDREKPGHREKVEKRVREMRGGMLNNSRFGERMRGSGPFADLIRSLFQTSCRRNGLSMGGPGLSTRAFRTGRPVQGTLFD
jgi:DNA repair photolyase